VLHIEHLNLVVRDIPAALAFYRAAFPHWEVRGGGEGNWYGKDRNWVHFGDEYQYLTFNDDGDEDARKHEGHQVGVSHFAFVTSDIDGIISRLTSAGYEIDNNGAVNPFRRNVYFIDPAGLEVEFVQYNSDKPSERNRYDPDN